MTDTTAKTQTSIDEIAKRTDRLEVDKQYDLNPEDYRELFYNSHECFMAHVSKDGYPIVSPMWYVVIDDMIHLTTIKDLRRKTAALIANPKMSVVMTNFSLRAEDVLTALTTQKITTQILGRYVVPFSRIDAIMAILIKAKAEISDDRDLRRQVHEALIGKYYPGESSEQRQQLVTAVDTPNRVIIKVHPEKIMHWDLGKMFGVH